MAKYPYYYMVIGRVLSARRLQVHITPAEPAHLELRGQSQELRGQSQVPESKDILVKSGDHYGT